MKKKDYIEYLPNVLMHALLSERTELAADYEEEVVRMEGRQNAKYSGQEGRIKIESHAAVFLQSGYTFSRG